MHLQSSPQVNRVHTVRRIDGFLSLTCAADLSLECRKSNQRTTKESIARALRGATFPQRLLFPAATDAVYLQKGGRAGGGKALVSFRRDGYPSSRNLGLRLNHSCGA